MSVIGTSSRLFLPDGLLDELEAEARKHAPRETGGMLLGYRAGGAETRTRLELVVTGTIDAGPRARRRRWWFTPDGLWQQRRMEEAYQASGRIATYLGDWHSHPRGIPRPSTLDRRTYARVASDPNTATDLPLMMILAFRKSLALGAYLVDSHRRLMDIEVHPYSP